MTLALKNLPKLRTQFFARSFTRPEEAKYSPANSLPSHHRNAMCQVTPKTETELTWIEVGPICQN